MSQKLTLEYSVESGEWGVLKQSLKLLLSTNEIELQKLVNREDVGEVEHRLIARKTITRENIIGLLNKLD